MIDDSDGLLYIDCIRDFQIRVIRRAPYE